MKTLFTLILSITSLQNYAFAREKMKIERDCTVKKLGQYASLMNVKVGDPIKMTTTTGTNYQPPFQVVEGANSLTVKGLLNPGTAGRYSYLSDSPKGNVFEIFRGTNRLYVLREGSTSTYTGKSQAVLLIETKKIAELECLEKSKEFVK